MKPYFLEFIDASEREFLALPRVIQRRIKTKMEFYMQTEDPLVFAKRLEGAKNVFRFRIGDYRVIVTPKDKVTFVILVILKVAHRREVYE